MGKIGKTEESVGDSTLGRYLGERTLTKQHVRLTLILEAAAIV